MMIQTCKVLIGIIIYVSILGNTQKTESVVSAVSVAKSDDSAQLELKLARLWTKFDELNIKVKKQSERIKLLEKGLMLGVIPEELLKDKLNLDADDSDKLNWNESPSQEKTIPIEKTEKKAEEIPYSELLKRAQAAFDGSRFGEAISLYQRIDASYREYTAEGQTLFWIGLSWYYLKEFGQASNHFKRLIDNYSESRWLPKTEYYIAKISLHQGLLRRALDQFKDLVGRYPNSDISEMASHEIKLLKERI